MLRDEKYMTLVLEVTDKAIVDKWNPFMNREAIPGLKIVAAAIGDSIEEADIMRESIRLSEED